MGVLWQVIVKELLQIRQDRRMILMVVAGPVIQLLVFGYAVNTDVQDVATLLVDQDHTAASRALWDAFQASGTFELAGVEEEAAAADAWLTRGAAQVALVIAPGYGEAVAAGASPRVQLLVDGSDAATTQVALGYAAAIVAGKGSEMVKEQVARAAAAAPAAAVPFIEARTRVWYNPDLKSRWFYVPAIVAMVLLLITMILSSMGVVREKEIGTMEQLIVTPIRPWQLLVGKLLPFAMIGLGDVALISAFAVFWFEVPLRGSFLVLVALTAPLLLCTLGLGLLMSTLVSTQQQAMMGSAFLLMVPMIYLSGLIFPIENMPRAIQLVTYAIPLRYYAIILRGIFLKGLGFAGLWRESLVLLLLGIGIMTVASLRFRKNLD